MSNTHTAHTYKRQLCALYLKGVCQAGTECNLAHGNRELRSFENPLYKAQLCTAYEQGGVCQMGDDCLFAHEESELRTDDVPLAAAESSASPKPSVKTEHENSRKSGGGGGYKSALCVHFVKNTSCHLGDNCTFAHGKEELMNVTAPDTTDPKYKTKLCLRFAQDDFCPNGEYCVFAHGEGELRSAQSGASASVKKSPLYKTTLCHNFTTLGVCPSGKNCSFAHGRFELRPVGFDGDFDEKIIENPKWKCVQCKIFLQTGHCNRVNCDYAHGDQELRTETVENPKVVRNNFKTVLCNNFANKGFCFHEDSCTFAHGEHELKSGKDSASALKLIRETTGMRKRPKNVIPGQQSAVAAAATQNVLMQPFRPLAMSHGHHQVTDPKLFAEFMEFKKFKEQTEGTAAAAASVHQFYGSAGAPRQFGRQVGPPMTMIQTASGYEPLKMMSNATGRPMAVSDLAAAAAASNRAQGGVPNGVPMHMPGDNSSRNGPGAQMRSRYGVNQSNGFKFESHNAHRGVEMEYSY